MRHFLPICLLLAFLIQWNDRSLNEEGFIIERSTGSGWIVIGQTIANNSQFRDAFLNPRTRYCYRVKAFNINGLSAYSPTTCRKTPH